MRNAVGDVIQFLYGEDGMDGAAIESQKIEALKATEVCRGPAPGRRQRTCLQRRQRSSARWLHAAPPGEPLLHQPCEL